MKSVTVRLPEPLVADIEAESRGRKISKSDGVREWLERAPRERRRTQSRLVMLFSVTPNSVNDVRRPSFLSRRGRGDPGRNSEFCNDPRYLSNQVTEEPSGRRMLVRVGTLRGHLGNRFPMRRGTRWLAVLRVAVPKAVPREAHSKWIE